MDFTLLKEFEIMLSTFVEGCTKYFAAGFVCYNLSFLCMMFFLARIVQLLFFLGRSTGLSVTSIFTGQMKAGIFYQNTFCFLYYLTNTAF